MDAAKVGNLTAFQFVVSIPFILLRWNNTMVMFLHVTSDNYMLLVCIFLPEEFVMHLNSATFVLRVFMQLLLAVTLSGYSSSEQPTAVVLQVSSVVMFDSGNCCLDDNLSSFNVKCMRLRNAFSLNFQKNTR